MNQHLDRIESLAAFLRPSATELLARCARDLKRTLMVVYGWRSMAEQALIYQQGRTLNNETGVWEITEAGKVVTRAKVSGHNVVTRDGWLAASVCLDVIPFHEDGSIDWSPDERFWDALYEQAWKVGLDPYGDPIGAYMASDKGHLEEPAWARKLDGLGLLLPSEASLGGQHV